MESESSSGRRLQFFHEEGVKLNLKATNREVQQSFLKDHPMHSYHMVPEDEVQEVKAVGVEVSEAARLTIAEDVAQVHFLGQDLLIDDRDATVIMVFPRGKPHGIVEMADEPVVEEPMHMAMKIFERQHNLASQETMTAGFETFTQGPVTQRHYQKVVRRKILQLFRKSGFKVITFPSVDGDEVFAKITLDLNGTVIKDLAERFSYHMPFKESAYKDIKPHGIYQGHEPMYRGRKPVLAYQPYKKEIGDLFCHFREVDQIRILVTQIHSILSVEQLKKQGVITNYFPVAKHADIKKLHSEWLVNRTIQRFCRFGATVAKVFTIPHYGSKDGLVRNFFGEEIAFFFRWFAFYTQMLGYLGAFGVLFHLIGMMDLTMINLSKSAAIQVQKSLHICFSAVMVVWATIFNQFFRNRMTRAQQDWGMKDFELNFLPLDRADFNPKLDGTWKQGMKRALSIAICVMFCLMFTVAISFVEKKKKAELEDEGEDGEGTFFKDHGTLIVVCTIKVWSIAWGYIAPLLAEMQNHRTQSRFDDALTTMLSMVKIFVTLWNFIYLAFFKKFTSPTCASSLEEVASKIWASEGFVYQNTTMANAAMQELRLPHFSYQTHTHNTTKFCAFGCFPASPAFTGPGAATNCYQMLQHELITFFFVHIAYTVVFLLYPMFKVKWEVVKELHRAKEQGGDKRYSWLQFQAKCPQYEYLSWGGSRVEDFLECAIGFALVTCFGILFPLLSFFAFLANMVEYRLLAYRMTHVTCRPYPRGASGIGSWQLVFNSISGCAVVVNVLLIAFVMYPFRSMDMRVQFGFFIVLEHVLLGIRAVISDLIPDEPQDVRRIEDFNAHFKRTMVKYPQLQVPPREQYLHEYAKVDIGLVEGETLDPGPPEYVDEDYDDTASTTSSDELPGSPWCCGSPSAFPPL